MSGCVWLLNGLELFLRVVLLVLQNLTQESILPMLVQESLKALGGLGLLSFGGKYIWRRVFEVCILIFQQE